MPMSSDVSLRSTAHKPKPRSSHEARIRSIISPLCRAVSVDGKWCITSGSALSRGVWLPIAVTPLTHQQACRVEVRSAHRSIMVASASFADPARDAGDHLDAVRAVEHERQPVDRLLVAAHQRHQLVGVEAGGQRRVQVVRPPTTARCSATRSRRCGRVARASSAA